MMNQPTRMPEMGGTGLPTGLVEAVADRVAKGLLQRWGQNPAGSNTITTTAVSSSTLPAVSRTGEATQPVTGEVLRAAFADFKTTPKENPQSTGTAEPHPVEVLAYEPNELIPALLTAAPQKKVSTKGLFPVKKATVFRLLGGVVAVSIIAGLNSVLGSPKLGSTTAEDTNIDPTKDLTIADIYPAPLILDVTTTDAASGLSYTNTDKSTGVIPFPETVYAQSFQAKIGAKLQESPDKKIVPAQDVFTVTRKAGTDNAYVVTIDRAKVAVSVPDITLSEGAKSERGLTSQYKLTRHAAPPIDPLQLDTPTYTYAKIAPGNNQVAKLNAIAVENSNPKDLTRSTVLLMAQSMVLDACGANDITTLLDGEAVYGTGSWFKAHGKRIDIKDIIFTGSYATTVPKKSSPILAETILNQAAVGKTDLMAVLQSKTVVFGGKITCSPYLTAEDMENIKAYVQKGQG